MRPLAPGQGCYAAWLTPQGRMITDAVVLAEEDTITLEVPVALGELIYRRLDAAIFAEDVLLTDEGAACGAWWACTAPAPRRIVAAPCGCRARGHPADRRGDDGLARVRQRAARPRAG